MEALQIENLSFTYPEAGPFFHPFMFAAGKLYGFNRCFRKREKHFAAFAETGDCTVRPAHGYIFYFRRKRQVYAGAGGIDRTGPRCTDCYGQGMA